MLNRETAALVATIARDPKLEKDRFADSIKCYYQYGANQHPHHSHSSQHCSSGCCCCCCHDNQLATQTQPTTQQASRRIVSSSPLAVAESALLACSNTDGSKSNIPSGRSLSMTFEKEKNLHRTDLQQQSLLRDRKLSALQTFFSETARLADQHCSSQLQNRPTSCLKIDPQRSSGSYENFLFNGIAPPWLGKPRKVVDFCADLMVFRCTGAGGGSSHKSSLPIVTATTIGSMATERRLRAFFQASPVHEEGSACPWVGKLHLQTPLYVPRRAAIQLVIRDNLGVMGKVFLVRLDLSDMPRHSQTLVRQKHYTVDVNSNRHLAHAVQFPLRRDYPRHAAEQQLAPSFDSNGNPLAPPSRQMIRIDGPVRLVFSFNQAAVNVGEATTPQANAEHSKGGETLEIFTELPSNPRYYPCR